MSGHRSAETTIETSAQPGTEHRSGHSSQPTSPDGSHRGQHGHCGGTGGCGGTGRCGGHTDSAHPGASEATTSPTCGTDGRPFLDARTIDPAIRQSAIFGVLIGLAPGAAVTIVSDQDPQPISDLVTHRLPDAYEVRTEYRGGDEWRVDFARR